MPASWQMPASLAPVRIVFVRQGARELYLAGKNAIAPATSASAGFDLVACLGLPGHAESVSAASNSVAPASGATGTQDGWGAATSTIGPGGRQMVPTGIAIQPLCPGLAGFVYSRSGIGTRDGLVVAQGVGVIDPDYTGEIFVCLLNTSGESRQIERGQRVAQLVFQPFVRPQWQEVENLAVTGRGAGGFGHTGR